MKTIRIFLYCVVMRIAWRLGYSLYTWAEDRRPGGGFRVKNFK